MKQMLLTAIAASFGLLVATAGAQDQQRTFRTSVRTVPIFATVADDTGRLVTDLEQEDFEVLDEGKPAPITFFDKQVQPISVVIAIDTSASMTLVLDFVKMAAEAFILRLLPADRAMVLSFADLVQTSPRFTSDRDALLRYLRTDLRFGTGTRLWDALYQGAAHLQKETARKAILVLSDGENTTSDMDGDAVLSRAHDDDVMVYAIGLRNRYRAGPTGPWVFTSPDRFLRKLTSQTGGGYFEISQSTELNSTFTRVADELHRQYLIGITPSAADGRTHKLQVRVKRPGMTARARQAYVAAKD
jgi:Ca-activated chloride channel family protein